MRISASGPRRNGDGAAVGRPGKRERKSSPRVKERITKLVVEVGNRASAWHDAAIDAQLAFEWWKNASQAHRATAAAVYLAAIEREEQAASEYSKALEACSTSAP